MKATDIKEIEAMTGAKVVVATKENSSFNSDFVLLDDNGTIRQAFTVRDINGKMCVDVFAAEYDTIAAALAYLNMSDEELIQNIEYINPDNTPSTMNANEEYNYLEAVTADVLNYIDENNITVTSDNRAEIEQQLNDELFVCDSVTDNASGSYTFNTWQAEKNLCHNLDLLVEACDEFGSDAAKLLSDGAEACDVTIRCYLLGQAISAALDEVETEEVTEE